MLTDEMAAIANIPTAIVRVRSKQKMIQNIGKSANRIYIYTAMNGLFLPCS